MQLQPVAGVEMKIILAVIQPHKADGVVDSLTEADIFGLTTFAVRGFGKERKDTVEVYRVSEYRMKLKPMVMLMTAVTDKMVTDTMNLIREHANTFEISAGKFWC